MLSFIVAIDEKGAIGYRNQLPWHMPADLQHFKKHTVGKPILMGRKTFESIGRPLPQRDNIIVTHDKNFQAVGCHVFHSLDAALEAFKEKAEIMIIGGAGIFSQLLPQADRLYLTRIHHTFVADTFLPEIDFSQWQEVEREPHAADERNPYAYTFITLERV